MEKEQANNKKSTLLKKSTSSLAITLAVFFVVVAFAAFTADQRSEEAKLRKAHFKAEYQILKDSCDGLNGRLIYSYGSEKPWICIKTDLIHWQSE